MKRADFHYDLPKELIAQEPRERGRSRMLVVTPPDGLEHDTFASFPERLGPRDLVVINDTRVIPARLYAEPKGQMKKPIEFLLTRQRNDLTWETWCKPAKRVRPGDRVTFSDALSATIEDKRDDGTVVIRFEGDAAEIERIGIPPLPPYIERPTPRDSDRESYQTVYARERGAAMIFLETNDKLQSAIRLYARLGFVHAPRTHSSPYERSNVYMELRFPRK